MEDSSFDFALSTLISSTPITTAKNGTLYYSSYPVCKSSTFENSDNFWEDLMMTFDSVNPEMKEFMSPIPESSSKQESVFTSCLPLQCEKCFDKENSLVRHHTSDSKSKNSTHENYTKLENNPSFTTSNGSLLDIHGNVCSTEEKELLILPYRNVESSCSCGKQKSKSEKVLSVINENNSTLSEIFETNHHKRLHLNQSNSFNLNDDNHLCPSLLNEQVIFNKTTLEEKCLSCSIPNTYKSLRSHNCSKILQPHKEIKDSSDLCHKTLTSSIHNGFCLESINEINCHEMFGSNSSEIVSGEILKKSQISESIDKDTLVNNQSLHANNVSLANEICNQSSAIPRFEAANEQKSVNLECQSDKTEENLPIMNVPNSDMEIASCNLETLEEAFGDLCLMHVSDSFLTNYDEQLVQEILSTETKIRSCVGEYYQKKNSSQNNNSIRNVDINIESEISKSEKPLNKDCNLSTSLVNCNHCKKLQYEFTKNNKTGNETKLLLEEVHDVKPTTDVQILLGLFEVDSVLSKSILLALSNQFKEKGGTQREILKLLKQGPFLSDNTKLKHDMKQFLNAAVNVRIIDKKSNRYFLREPSFMGNPLDFQKKKFSEAGKKKTEDGKDLLKMTSTMKTRSNNMLGRNKPKRKNKTESNRLEYRKELLKMASTMKTRSNKILGRIEVNSKSKIPEKKHAVKRKNEIESNKIGNGKELLKITSNIKTRSNNIFGRIEVKSKSKIQEKKHEAKQNNKIDSNKLEYRKELPKMTSTMKTRSKILGKTKAELEIQKGKCTIKRRNKIKKDELESGNKLLKITSAMKARGNTVLRTGPEEGFQSKMQEKNRVIKEKNRIEDSDSKNEKFLLKMANKIKTSSVLGKPDTGNKLEIKKNQQIIKRRNKTENIKLNENGKKNFKMEHRKSKSSNFKTTQPEGKSEIKQRKRGVKRKIENNEIENEKELSKRVNGKKIKNIIPLNVKSGLINKLEIQKNKEMIKRDKTEDNERQGKKKFPESVMLEKETASKISLKERTRFSQRIKTNSMKQ